VGRHFQTQMGELERQLELIKVQRAAAAAISSEDRARYDWFGGVCPCGLEPGACIIHPRARPSQRPPEGDWNTLLALAGRGWGKTRASTEWLRREIESGRSRRAAIVGATAADVRDILIEGESGVLAIAPPWNKPRYEPSKRRLTWRNGAIATCFSAEEPDRLRGYNTDCAIVDELCAWERTETLDMLRFGLRLGHNPQMYIATTPKPTKLLKSLVADPAVITIRGSTFENRNHLAPTFFSAITARYQNTRLGRQELEAEILNTSEAAWFSGFEKAKHVSVDAEYDPRFAVHCGIDAGTSRYTAAIWFQVIPVDRYRNHVRAFGDFLSFGKFSEDNAKAIAEHGESLPCGRHLDTVRIDPASGQQTGIGVAAYVAYEQVFGSRKLEKSPGGSVTDTLDLMECLLERGLLTVHPRCANLIESFTDYKRAERAGEFIDKPEANQTGIEDCMDAFRYGIKSQFPEGRIEQRQFRQIRVSELY
jgi:Terminase large subunit, T4likevirus-type, N-terminal